MLNSDQLLINLYNFSSAPHVVMRCMNVEPNGSHIWKGIFIEKEGNGYTLASILYLYNRQIILSSAFGDITTFLTLYWCYGSNSEKGCNYDCRFRKRHASSTKILGTPVEREGKRASKMPTFARPRSQ